MRQTSKLERDKKSQRDFSFSFLVYFLAHIDSFDTAVVSQEKVVVRNIPDLCNFKFLSSIPRITFILVKISFIFHEFLIKFLPHYSNNKYLINNWLFCT